MPSVWENFDHVFDVFQGLFRFPLIAGDEVVPYLCLEVNANFQNSNASYFGFSNKFFFPWAI